MTNLKALNKLRDSKNESKQFSIFYWSICVSLAVILAFIIYG